MSSIDKELQVRRWLQAPQNFCPTYFLACGLTFLSFFQGVNIKTCQQWSEFARFMSMYICSCAAVHEIPSRLYAFMHIYLKFATLCIDLVLLLVIYKVSGHE